MLVFLEIDIDIVLVMKKFFLRLKFVNEFELESLLLLDVNEFVDMYEDFDMFRNGFVLYEVNWCFNLFKSRDSI